MDQLEVEDPDNNSFELTYTVLSVPSNGVLTAYSVPLSVGDQFTQRAIETFDLKYTHSGDESLEDAFKLVVEDGTGGFYAPIDIPVKISDDAVVDVVDPIDAAKVPLLFPVPANDQIQLRWATPLSSDTQVHLFDAQGRPLQRIQLERGISDWQISVNNLSTGYYVLRILDEQSVIALPFTIAR